MSDKDIAVDLGEIRATVASELGRLKLDFVSLADKVEKLREHITTIQQISASAPMLEQRLQKATDEIHSIIRRIEAVERTDASTEKFVDRELQHLRNEIRQEISKAILELDNSIRERLPANTITKSIEELFELIRKAQLDLQAYASDSDVASTEFVEIKAKQSRFDDKLKAIEAEQVNQRIENAKQTLKLSFLVGVLVTILNLVVSYAVKSFLEGAKQAPTPKIETKTP